MIISSKLKSGELYGPRFHEDDMKNFIIIVATVLIFCCCNACDFEKEKIIMADIVFNEPIDSGFYRITIKDDTVYTFEPDNNTIMAFDLLTNTKKWRESPFGDKTDWIEGDGIINTNFCIIGDSIWALCRFNNEYYLIEMNILDGNRIKMVQIGIKSTTFFHSGLNIVSSGAKIYLFMGGGLCEFDPLNIILIDSTEQLYSGSVTNISPFSDVNKMGFYIEHFSDSIVFSYVHADISKRGLTRFNLISRMEVWDIEGESFFDYYVLNNNSIIGGSIDTISPSEDSNFVSYDWNTGLLNASYFSDHMTLTPPTCIDNKIIQTSSVNHLSAGKPYIYCLDADTLNVIWKHDSVDGQEFAGSNVQVNKDIVYMPCSNGLYLYDLKTGNLLAADKGIDASNVSNDTYSIKYKDLLITQIDNALIGVKMNFINTASGLKKE